MSVLGVGVRALVGGRLLTQFNGAGKLDLTVPPYININHDTGAKQLELSIKDGSQKNQKEMWGMLSYRADQGKIGRG